ncbi:acyltransferase family protein [Nitrosomonas oligotropha]|uniref:Peptidoglycan/LPS O-acetylase OafA/YrhL, contains acyltransferase and SGNH-hydrolase domains n=1 Tax=Nitrosomonas oligotropha TaxID=42354 RepID=A0A1H8T928_9PROT|nr:acyltransferase [Nitrosomonas oligotropha]SDX23114.1 Peptidoglycan/LPS O-acetylase OafA/YrhL, contains acyltransferase and SGNH-hydrolase domains [Nitrosomonas oligotropha]SEO87412.1 Peptidoglycan/LPS O-acetylase OafA/YrhL, contains acyltransferase and SGNH-hydrolase domains [Nitrosomonas oligotropha]
MLKTLTTLQAGRALAAISVAAFHLSSMMELDRYGGQEVFREYTKHGHLGVDFFFVLSGFIIFLAHVDDIGKPDAWRIYIYRRFVRLFPIYWLYTGTFVLLIALGVGNADTVAKMPQTFGDWITSLSLIRFTDANPPLPVAWTLFHELAFYAVFSILILNYRIGLVAFGVFMFFPIILFHYVGVDERTPFNVYTSAHNLYFLFGMGAMWLCRYGGRGVVEFTIGTCLTIFALVTMPLPHELSKLLLGFGFALVLVGAAKLELSGHLHIPYLLRLIGDASYTIYLIHTSISGLLLKIVIKVGFHQIIGAEGTYIVVLTGTIALGCLAYLVIERPLLNSLRRRVANENRQDN